jgi:hypothetical protein
MKVNIVNILIFLLMLSFPAIAGGTVSGVDAKENGGRRVVDARILLNTYTAFAEEHFDGILRGLKVLAVTEEARSGDWNALKGPLAGFGRSGINAAAVWYARTDGSYYTVEKGLTDQNLADRQYFPRLMAGHNVVGDLIISKSTGKRAAVIAVPILKDGKVIGALGVSVSADKVSRMLQERMSLPRDMVFYALDAKGQCSLHRESSLLFAFPSDLGSKTLKEAVKEMLPRQEGTVRYEFHGEKTIFFKRNPVRSRSAIWRDGEN